MAAHISEVCPANMTDCNLREKRLRPVRRRAGVGPRVPWTAARDSGINPRINGDKREHLSQRQLSVYLW